MAAGLPVVAADAGGPARDDRGRRDRPPLPAGRRGRARGTLRRLRPTRASPSGRVGAAVARARAFVPERAAPQSARFYRTDAGGRMSGRDRARLPDPARRCRAGRARDDATRSRTRRSTRRSTTRPGTFPEFRGRATSARRGSTALRLLRRHHRLALPLLAAATSRPARRRRRRRLQLERLGARGRRTGRKVVYCHTPARWLYQADATCAGGRGRAGSRRSRCAPALRRWDRARPRAPTAISRTRRVARERIRLVYGIDAEVLPPPPALRPSGPQRARSASSRGSSSASRACSRTRTSTRSCERSEDLPDERLVVVGDGPGGGAAARDRAGRT